jgi:hypothetical protein
MIGDKRKKSKNVINILWFRGGLYMDLVSRWQRLISRTCIKCRFGANRTKKAAKLFVFVLTGRLKGNKMM